MEPFAIIIAGSQANYDFSTCLSEVLHFIH